MTSVATISNHQSTPVAKATKAQIQKHQNDLAFSILVTLGDTLSEGSIASQSLNAPKTAQLRNEMEALKNNSAVKAVFCQTFDANAIVRRVQIAMRELSEIEVNAQDLKMLDIFTEKMEELITKPELYTYLFKFNSVKDSLFEAEKFVTGATIKALKESKIIQSVVIRRVREAKERNPEFYGQPSNACCLLL